MAIQPAKYYLHIECPKLEIFIPEKLILGYVMLSKKSSKSFKMKQKKFLLWSSEIALDNKTQHVFDNCSNSQLMHLR